MGLKNVWWDLKCLFGPSSAFFDMEATITEYFKIVPAEKRKKVSNYRELYSEALRYVEQQNFDENTKDIPNYFYELSEDEGIIAVLLGFVAYGTAVGIDQNGKEIEKAINDALPKDYDVNNPFDTKQGYGHRVFGHDPLTFGVKNIPGDTVIKVKDETGKRVLIRIGEYIGVGTDKNVSMWDLIWHFYGDDNDKLKGVMNCVKHSIVHFSKDIFTPAGLPLPFISLFNKYEYIENLDAHALQYKDSLMKKHNLLHMEIKASDFVSLFVIDSFLQFYSKEKGATDTELIRSMKLVAMGTCISMQMAKIIMSEELMVGKKGNKPIVAGAKINVFMNGVFWKTVIDEMYLLEKARLEVNKEYKKMIRGNGV